MESSLQEKKLELIQWLSLLEDPTIIEELLILRDRKNEDWWDEIPDKERVSIEKGLKNAEEGNLVPHSEVRKSYEKWL